MDRRSISMFLDEEGTDTELAVNCKTCQLQTCSARFKAHILALAVKRERSQRRTSNGSAVSSSTPPIPEESEDMDSDDTYANDQASSPPQRQAPPPPSHKHHAPPSRSDTRPHFREPPLVWQPERPTIVTGGAQYPGEPCRVISYTCCLDTTNFRSC